MLALAFFKRLCKLRRLCVQLFKYKFAIAICFIYLKLKTRMFTWKKRILQLCA